MRKLILRVLTILILLCMVCCPLSARAAGLVDVDRQCSLELEYSSNGTGFAGLDIQIYRIAEMYADGTYALAAPFNQIPVKIHGIRYQREWRDAANTLAAYIAAQQIPTTKKEKTNEAGKAMFTDLETGIYLVMGLSVKNETHTYQFENFCVFLPTPQSNGALKYDMAAKPKFSVTPNPEQPGEISYQVVKLWKDAGNEAGRPERVEVDILKNGVVQETVTLHAENNWTYSWTAPEGEDAWTVVEKNVPEGYSVVMTASGTAFSITNTRPAEEDEPPKTGDSFSLRFWLSAMSISGMMLMLCGTLPKRKRR